MANQADLRVCQRALRFRYKNCAREPDSAEKQRFSTQCGIFAALGRSITIGWAKPNFADVS